MGGFETVPGLMPELVRAGQNGSTGETQEFLVPEEGRGLLGWAPRWAGLRGRELLKESRDDSSERGVGRRLQDGTSRRQERALGCRRQPAAQGWPTLLPPRHVVQAPTPTPRACIALPEGAGEARRSRELGSTLSPQQWPSVMTTESRWISTPAPQPFRWAPEFLGAISSSFNRGTPCWLLPSLLASSLPSWSPGTSSHQNHVPSFPVQVASGGTLTKSVVIGNEGEVGKIASAGSGGLGERQGAQAFSREVRSHGMVWILKISLWGRSGGTVVKCARSALGPRVRWFRSRVRTWHHLASRAVVGVPHIK